MSLLEYGRHFGQLRRRRRAYAPTSNAASHDNHDEIDSWVSLSFPYMMSMGLRLAAGAQLRMMETVKLLLIGTYQLGSLIREVSEELNLVWFVECITLGKITADLLGVLTQRISSGSSLAWRRICPERVFTNQCKVRKGNN